MIGFGWVKSHGPTSAVGPWRNVHKIVLRDYPAGGGAGLSTPLSG